MQDKITELLRRNVERPGRYAGGERGQIVKETASLRTALVFPDVYEIAMSHQGLRLLYFLINNHPGKDWAAERVFAAWPDYERLLRESQKPLTSLETNRPLRDFDLVGITLQYELSYTNVLNILDLGGLPLYAVDRTASDPIVMGGGSCCSNPAPMERFFDCFFIGEAEERYASFLEVIERTKGRPRRERLKELEKVPGIYVPKSLGGRGTARRQWVEDFDASPLPSQIITPNIRIVHDRVGVEINRGCTRGCRFCQAGFLYRPLRHRSPERILQNIEEGLEGTGFEEVSLLSLSAQDHPSAYDLSREIMRRMEGAHTSLSFPSQRVDAFNIAVIEEIQKERKTGITLAPEVGSARMERIINKGIDLERIHPLCDEIFSAGWSLIKLYFMIGLPFEEDEDAEAIAERLLRLAREAKRHKRACGFNVTISVFAPKCHTPFQWAPCADRETLSRRVRLIRDRLSAVKNIKLSISGQETSALESVLSRGGEQIGAVIESVWRKGGTFDAWSEHFKLSRWEEAFQENGLDLWAEAERGFEETAILPWDGVETGIDKRFLLEEWHRSRRGEKTPFCAVEHCNTCGLERVTCRRKPDEAIDTRVPRRETPPKRDDTTVLQTIDFAFSRGERTALLGQLDTARIIERALRRAGAMIPAAYSQGFNPRVRLSFVSALALGLTSRGEWASVDLCRRITPLEFVKALNNALPEDIRVVEAVDSSGKKRLPKRFVGSRFRVDLDPAVDAAELERAIENFRQTPSVTVTREKIKRPAKGKGRPKSSVRVIELKELVLSLEFVYNENRSPALLMTLSAPPEGSVTPLEVLSALGAERATGIEREAMLFEGEGA